MKISIKRTAALFLAAAAAVTCLSLPVYGESDTETSYFTELPEAAVQELPSVNAGVPGVMFTLPSDMRASVITPSVDFYKDPEEDADALESELDNIFSDFSEIGLNTVIINTVCDDKAFYSLANGDEDTDPAAAAIASAYNCGISPYIVLDLGHLMSDCRSGAEAIDTLVSRVHRFALRYQCAGIILDDYYARRNVESFTSYMNNGSGIGYKNWLYDTAEQYFRTAAEVIRGTDNSIAAGFIINDMWANSASDPSGSETSDAVQAYYDGYSDTKSFIEKDYVDFVLLRAYGSVTSTALPFEKVTGWWGALTDEYDIPLYVVHHNEYLGTSTAGWGGEDQLLKQLTIAKKIDSYSGSVFNSFGSLLEDPLGSTETLTSYFNEQIDEGTLFEDLKMTSPQALKYTTTEATATFMGSFDSNFPVYFNGEEIKLNDAGNFYFEKKLADGLNTFTISHKSKTYTYNITRKITVLKGIGTAISEGKSLTVDGGTKITLTARAYKGATVYGTVNGTTVGMKETTDTADEDEVNSSYARYTGTYTVPAGIIGQKQELGKIHIFASYSGYSMEAVGASVTVNAEPEPVKKEEAVIVTDAESSGSGEVFATLASTRSSSETVKYVKALSDFTMVYDGKTADDIPSPVFSQLPAGSLEIYKSTSGNYYVTESGKRIAASASVLEDGPAIDRNDLFVKSIGTTGGQSYIKLKLDHRTGFNMRLAGNSYYTAWDGEYNVSDFTATHLYITFENVTSVTTLPSFEHNQVFRSGKWDTVTEDNGTKFRLILELRQPGVYVGHSAKYNSDGDLILWFPVPVNTLSGITVVIDPGHGYGKSPDVFDPGAIGEVVEQEVVLAISKELESQLKAAGANVVRLPTESEFLLTKDRPKYARQYGCDIYISVHANKATGEARGTEVYYFTSYSQPLAAQISSAVSKYYSTNVYSDGVDKNRGARYSYYHVTLQQDFPSVLVETGFVDNIMDAMALASETHRKGIAAGIVTGIKNYIARSSISYASEGYSAADSSAPADVPEEGVSEEPAEPDEPTQYEEVPDAPEDPEVTEETEEVTESDEGTAAEEEAGESNSESSTEGEESLEDSEEDIVDIVDDD